MGYRCEIFVDPIPDSLLCDLCNNVYRCPVITSCDHVYCEECLRSWMTNNVHCPKGCREITFEQNVTHLLPLQILVGQLNTRCVNYAEGCDVVTQLSDMLAHLEVCDYVKKDAKILERAIYTNEQASTIGSLNQVFVCAKGCGLPLLFHDASEHDCVKSLQAQVQSLQAKLSRSEHEREKVSARLVKREESMQERFTQLEQDLRLYQEQTLSYELKTRDQNSQINYLKRQLDSREADKVNPNCIFF